MPHVKRIICLEKIIIILALLSLSFRPVSEVVYCSVDDDQDLAVVAVNLKGVSCEAKNDNLMIVLQDIIGSYSNTAPP